MPPFDRSIREVDQRLRGMGLAHLVDGVRGIAVVRQESFHDLRTYRIGLNPRDVRRPFAAFHRRPYLLVHELGHQFVEACVSRADRRALACLFGDYDAPYRRAPKPRCCDADHVSRYAMTHPAEDIVETLAVHLWRAWDPRAVEALLSQRSPLVRRKIAAVARLVRRSRERGRSLRSGP
jgi:hypothetical protein